METTGGSTLNGEPGLNFFWTHWTQQRKWVLHQGTVVDFLLELHNM